MPNTAGELCAMGMENWLWNETVEVMMTLSADLCHLGEGLHTGKGRLDIEVRYRPVVGMVSVGPGCSQWPRIPQRGTPRLATPRNCWDLREPRPRGPFWVICSLGTGYPAPLPGVEVSVGTGPLSFHQVRGLPQSLPCSECWGKNRWRIPGAGMVQADVCVDPRDLTN